MGIEELRTQIMIETQRLGELQAKNGERNEVIYNDGGEVKYRDIKTDNDEEITKLRLHIMEMKQQLQTMIESKKMNQENQKSNIEELKEFEELENEKAKEAQKQAFEMVKKRYKQISLFERIKNKKPDFKKISKLSTDELNFLISLSNGNTVFQKQHNEERTEKYRRDGMKETEINKRTNERNMNSFYQGLVDPNYLHMNMEHEEESLGRSR